VSSRAYQLWSFGSWLPFLFSLNASPEYAANAMHKNNDEQAGKGLFEKNLAIDSLQPPGGSRRA
jgi:hypothetical protein